MILVSVIKKIGKILNKHQKVRIIQLALLMLLGGIFETLSVSLILPFMEVIMNSESIMKNSLVQEVCNLFSISSSLQFVVFLAIILALLFVFKNIYLMIEYYMQYRFVFGNMFALQKNILHTYIGKPYEFFLGVTSGELLRVISSDTGDAFNLLSILLNMFTEVTVSLMLIVTVFVIAPSVTAIMALILVVMMVLIFVFLKPVLHKIGINKQQSSANMNKWMLQSIQGIKELKVMHKESYFEENFNESGLMFVRSLRLWRTLDVAPRFIIEGACMGGLFVAVAIMMNRGDDISSLVPVLTAVAMAAIRLLPSVNRISSALNAIAYSEPMLDKVIENMNNMASEKEKTESNDSIVACKEEFGFDNCIELNDVFYSYPESNNYVLEGTSMTIKKGESVGIIGPSGAGKTTTVDILLGLLFPKKGCVNVDGKDIKNHMNDWLKLIAYIPQSIYMLDDTIRANVAFGVKYGEEDEKEIWRALEEAALSDYVKELPEGLETQIGERGVRLSGGQRQRIGIARALYSNPELLVFDEATSSLDNNTESAIMESIQRFRGTKTMIIIAHRLSTIESCDHVYKVENGKLIQER